MAFIQLLLTAASLSAVAGGTWGVDRLLDRYAQTPERIITAEATVREDDEEEESELLY